MKIVAALTDPAYAAPAQEQGADIVELRLDLMDGEPLALIQKCRASCTLPVIATFRSVQEGGRYAGSPDDWFRMIEPLLPHIDFVDVEQRFSQHAGAVKTAGTSVIASFHTGLMPDLYELFDLERQLRTYGDIVKIVVTPQSTEDLIELISFTYAVKQPICTGVMGTAFRHARAILPLFGSELAYCNPGDRTAAGQYTVEEFRTLYEMLTR